MGLHAGTVRHRQHDLFGHRFACGGQPQGGRRAAHEPEGKAVARGLDWLGQHYTTKNNPNTAGVELPWLLYYLETLEDAGRLTKASKIGNHDWFPRARPDCSRIKIGNRAPGRVTATRETTTH